MMERTFSRNEGLDVEIAAVKNDYSQLWPGDRRGLHARIWVEEAATSGRTSRYEPILSCARKSGNVQ